MDALISQINCGTWIILIYESNLDGLKWIEYIDKGDTKRKIERKVGETESGRKRGGKEGERRTIINCFFVLLHFLMIR